MRTVCSSGAARLVCSAGFVALFGGAGAVGSERQGVVASGPARAADAAVDAALVDEIHFCTLPSHDHPRVAQRGALLVPEAEPNDSILDAQALPLGTGAGESTLLTVDGGLSANTDEDFYSIEVATGDVIGVAVVSDVANVPDTEVEILRPDGTRLLQNDFTTGGRGDAYPPDSPLPVPVWDFDSFGSFVAPESGMYTIRVGSFADGSSGNYELSVGTSRTPLELADPAERQIIFVDFDGATIDPLALFGRGPSFASLSPLSAFLGNVGLGPADESAVIDAVIAVVEARFSALEGVRPNVEYEIRNSRDDADPFGQPNVSRVIVGGTVSEFGIDTIGIAEHIDPGNFSTDDTAVVLLDRLLGPAGGSVSAATFARAAGFTVIDVAGRGIGNVVAHEAGHYLGNWHTQTDNAVRNIMDRGSTESLQRSIYGLGPDLVFGSADDDVTEFLEDVYDSGERSFFGVELTEFRTASALLTLFDPAAADFDMDGDVDANDLSFLLGAWGSSDPDADLTGDGTVGVDDLALLLGLWTG